MAQLGSALDWGSRGRKFKSCQPDGHEKGRSQGIGTALFHALSSNKGAPPRRFRRIAHRDRLRQQGDRDLVAVPVGAARPAAQRRLARLDLQEREAAGFLRRVRYLRDTVQLADVELLTEQTSRMYGHPPLRVDPREAVAMAQGLRERGMTVDDKQLTEASVGKIGANLHLLLREHRMALSDESDLIDELLNVRLKATGLGGFSIPRLLIAARKSVPQGGTGLLCGASLVNLAYRNQATRGQFAAIGAAQRNQTEAQGRAGIGLVVPGSANDR